MATTATTTRRPVLPSSNPSYRAGPPPPSPAPASLSPLTTRSTSSARLASREPWVPTPPQVVERKKRGKGKGKAVAFVVGARSEGSGEEGDAEEESGVRREEEEREEEVRGEPRIEEIVRWQIRQPTYTLDSLDLDCLLPLGIADYTFVLSSPPFSSPSSSSSTSSTSSSSAPIPPKMNRVSLGKGKFSEVLLARKGDVEYALKHTPLHPHHPLIATRLLREPTILAQLLPHPNLVKVFETVRTPGHFYLVEENLRDSVTLETLVTSSPDGVLEVGMAWEVLLQLASVVKSLHEPLRVCHRDIKPENILVHVTPPTEERGEPTLLLKLLDFGLATHFSSSEAKLTTCCGSPAYHSPELWKGLRESSGSVKYWGPEVDIWCLGLTLLRCLTPNKYPLGIAHSSIFALSDKVVDALLAVSDERMRRTLAGFMHMDGEKRMKAFDAFCATQNGVVGPDPVPEGKKEFKSTTFVPTEARHTLDLPLLSMGDSRHSLETVANGLASRSPSRSRHRASGQASGVPSPDMTPDPSSPWASLYDSLPSTPKTPAFDYLPYPPPIEIVLLNPTDEPIRRSTSYIKYALRCAGILYHVRDDALSDSGFSAYTPFVEAPNPFEEDDSQFTCYLQCVIKLPPSSPPSKASSALIAALRPPLHRAHTTGAPVGRSSSTPPIGGGKGGKKQAEEIKALVFFLSIRREVKMESSSGRSTPGKGNASPPSSASRRSRKRRKGDRIIVTLSDERALEAVRDALRIGTDSPIVEPTPTEEEVLGRGRTTRDERATTRITTSGSREARDRRTKSGGEGLGLELGNPAGVEKKGFFDFAFARPQWLGARSQSVAVGVGGRRERREESGREEGVAMAVGGFV